MAFDGWVEFNGVEIANLSRTAQLAETLGINTVKVRVSSVSWIQDALGGVDYGDVTTAPWFDPGVPASAEFAGFLPFAFAGMDDSTRQSEPREYITDGGSPGHSRSTTLSIVANGALVATSERGAEFGKRWLSRVLTGGPTGCGGHDLRYFRYGDAGAGQALRREVKLTRAISVVGKRRSDCASTWLTTFTLTAGDPYEYGEPIPQFTLLGGADTAVGPGVASQGSVTTAMQVQTCPVYDYSPIYDPLYPALEPAPPVPDFYPTGWNLLPGSLFKRYWVRLQPVEPSSLNVVPIITLQTPTDARRVRVSFWPSDSTVEDQCDPLFEAVASYLPPVDTMYVDGQQRAVYVWDGGSPAVRRADSLVYTSDARPINWTAFNDPGGLLVTLDIFYKDALALEGDGEVRVGLTFVPKSD